MYPGKKVEFKAFDTAPAKTTEFKKSLICFTFVVVFYYYLYYSCFLIIVFNIRGRKCVLGTRTNSKHLAILVPRLAWTLVYTVRDRKNMYVKVLFRNGCGALIANHITTQFLLRRLTKSF